jgi:carboxymethylenebutenolidase
MCIGDDCDLENPERRAFLRGTAATIVSLSAFGLPAGESSPPTRVLDAPGIIHGAIEFGGVGGYLARPKAKGKYRPVLVVAGNRITEEYIPNTCAALAVAGYVALAPNIFHVLPDTARTPAEMREALRGRTDDDVLRDIRTGAEYLRTRNDVKRGFAGILGFCYGGRMAMLYAAKYHDVAAVVPYHPGQMAAAEVASIRVPVQIHSGTADRNVPVAWIRELEDVFRKQGTPVEVFLYEGADHGFLAYTRPYYHPVHAMAAWKRTIEFLNENLRR